MRLKTLLFSFLLSLVTCLSFSQNGNDTILFINGKTLVTTITDIDTINALVCYVKPKNSKKIKTIDGDEIFSITDKEGEHVIYVMDTLGNELSEAEMRQYIFGQQDGRKVVKGTGGFFANFLISFAAGATGSFLSPAVPFLIAGAVGLGGAKIDEDKVTHPEYMYNEAYKLGYEREAKRKRRLKALLGGGIGLIIGLSLSVVL